MTYLKPIFVLASILILILLSGCTSSYVDPALHKVDYKDIVRIQEPISVHLSVEFQINGTFHEKNSKLLFPKVERFFKSTGIFEHIENNPPLTITLNNVGDIGSAAAKGFVTGLTLGLVGSGVTDGYVMTAIYIPNTDKKEFKGTYNHAIYSTIGLKGGPENLEALPLMEAFDRVLEDMLLNFLGDLQDQGYLSSLEK